MTQFTLEQVSPELTLKLSREEAEVGGIRKLSIGRDAKRCCCFEGESKAKSEGKTGAGLVA